MQYWMEIAYTLAHEVSLFHHDFAYTRSLNEL